MAGAYGFMANSEIEIPLNGGTFQKLSKGDFVVFGNVDPDTSIGYIFHFRSTLPQDVTKSEVIARDLELLLKGWQASRAIIGFDTKEAFEDALVSEQAAQTAAAQAAAEQTSKGKNVKQNSSESPKRKENLALCFAVTGLICWSIYMIVKK